MSNTSQTSIDGNQSISRDLVVGGKATVRNNAEFDRNVSVKGWFDAPNIKHAFKGLYATVSALESAYPKPQGGWYALVAPLEDTDSDTSELSETKTQLEDVATLYWVRDGKWAESGLSSGQLQPYVDEFESVVSELQSALATIRTDVDEAVEDVGTAKRAVESLSEEVSSDYVTFDDVVVFDGENDKNGVMSVGMGYQLSRLHKASAHISHFLEGEHTIFDGYLETPRSIYYLEDMGVFAASAVEEKQDAPVLYKTWGENEKAGFHESDAYMSQWGSPYCKLYFNGYIAYMWDNNLGELVRLGDFGKYISVNDLASGSSAGIVKVSSGNGLSISDGTISMGAATESSAGAMSAGDKTFLDSLTADLATESTNGYMSSKDKVVVDNVAKSIPAFSGILNEEVTPLYDLLEDVYALWWVAPMGMWVAQKSNGIYYTQWTESGIYQAMTYYDTTADRVYNCDGVLYRYDANVATLVKIGDMSMYITVSDIATEDGNGLMSSEYVKELAFVYDAIHSGRITHGTMRFDNYCCSKRLNGSIDEETVADSYDGIMWLKDKKMFVAYRAILTIDDCGCASVKYTFYTHWVTAHLYMEHIAEECGLWQEKVYIFNGCVFVWKRCEKQLVLAGAGLIEEMTTDDIDAALADFEFVDPSVTSGITSIDVQTEEPLVASVSKNDNEAIVKLTITEASEEEVNNIFGINE